MLLNLWTTEFLLWAVMVYNGLLQIITQKKKKTKSKDKWVIYNFVNLVFREDTHSVEN